MVDLPIPQEPLTTAEAPETKVSPYVTSRMGSALDESLHKVGSGLDAVAVPLAQQAGRDAAAAAVTRSPDGQMSVATPANSFILGQAGDAYEKAVTAGTIANVQIQTGQHLNDLAQQFQTDPAGFHAALGSYIDGLRGQFGNSEIGQNATNHAQQLGLQYSNGIVDAAAKRDVSNSLDTVNTALEQSKNEAFALAKGGMTSGPQWDSATSRVDGYLTNLGNPAFKIAPAAIQAQRDSFHAQLTGQSILGAVDKDVQASGVTAAVKNLHDAINSPDVELSPVERQQYIAQGEARVRFLTGQNAAAVDANKQTVTALDSIVKTGKSMPDGAFEAAKAQSVALGDTETTQKLVALQATYGIHAVTSGLSPQQQAVAQLPAGEEALGRVQGAILGQESGNRDNPGTSVTGAKGPGQVEPATFAQYAKPGERIDNPADNRAVSARIVADYFTRYNGDAQRVAVAYFSGPGNVAPPNSTNPWIADKADPTGKTTSSYVADVAGRIAPQPSANGVPFTDAQIKANPFLLSTWAQKIAGDPETQRKAATAMGDSIERSIMNGVIPNNATLMSYEQLTGELPEFAPQRERIESTYLGNVEAQTAGGMTAADGRAHIDALKDQAKAVGSIFQGDIAQHAADFYKQGNEALKSDPTGTAVARGWVKQAPPPLDVNNPQTLPQAFAARAAVATAIAAHTGDPAQSAISPQELPMIKAALSNPDPAVKAAVYGAIAPLPDDIRRATLKGLAGNEPASMAEAAAGSMMTSRPDLAVSIFRGQAAMKTDERFDPEPKQGSKTDYFSQLDKSLPASIFPLSARTDPTGPYATMATMAKARYADLAAQRGTTKFDSNLLDQAIGDVTGGVLSHNGGPLIAPTPGMSQGDFDGVMRGVSDSDLAGVKTLGGQPVTAADVRGNGQLESIGDGRYFVKLGHDPAKPLYAYNSNGGKPSKFMLDLRNRTPIQSPDNWSNYFPMQP